MKRLERFDKTVNRSEVAKFDGYKYLSNGLPSLVIGVMITFMYGALNPSSVLQLFALIGIILGIVFIIFGSLKLYQA